MSKNVLTLLKATYTYSEPFKERLRTRFPPRRTGAFNTVHLRKKQWYYRVSVLQKLISLGLQWLLATRGKNYNIVSLCMTG